MQELRFRYAFVGKELKLLENVVLLVDDRHIVSIEEVSEVDNSLLCMPGLFNAHVHSADFPLRGVRTDSLEMLVGKGGIKHRFLKNQSKSELKRSILHSYNEAMGMGVLGWSDFREGSLDDIIHYPVENHNFIPFGRPTVDEIEDIPDSTCIGFRSIRSFDADTMILMSRIIAEGGGKSFIHVSEGNSIRKYSFDMLNRSDIAFAIDDMHVDALIHITHADSADIELMDKTSTPAILCVRSNIFTNSGLPPIDELLDRDIKLGIGTDNAMFHKLSIWDEMKSLVKIIPYDRILSMATVEGADICGLDWGLNVGNSNFMSISLPAKIERRNIKEWIVSNADYTDIVDKWSSTDE